MGHRPDSGQRAEGFEGDACADGRDRLVRCLLAARRSALRAGEPSPVWKDGWTINIPGRSNWVSDGTPSPFYLQSTPVDALRPRRRQEPLRVRRLFDWPHTSASARTWAWQHAGDAWRAHGRAARQQRLHPVVRSAPLSRRRPAPGLRGQQAAAVVVGRRMAGRRCALLNGNRTFDTGGGVVNSPAAEFRQQRFGHQCRWIARPVVLVRQCVEIDARLSRRLFQRLDGVQHHGTAADNATRVNHGPMVRFSIQK